MLKAVVSIFSQVRDHLKADDSVNNTVYFRPYEDICAFLENYAAQEEGQKKRMVWLSKGCSQGLANLVPSAQRIMELSPVALLKAVKNPTELEGFKQCHVR